MVYIGDLSAESLIKIELKNIGMQLRDMDARLKEMERDMIALRDSIHQDIQYLSYFYRGGSVYSSAKRRRMRKKKLEYYRKMGK